MSTESQSHHPDPDPAPGPQPTGPQPGTPPGPQSVGPQPDSQPGAYPPSAGRPSQPPRQGDVFGWVRGLGVVRGSDRWVGGVASGIAHRWGVDPILIRGLFIVAAIFLGIGVLAYGLLWLFLPEPDGRIHVQEAGRGHWTSGMTGGLIVTILGLGGARAGFWFGERGFGGAFWGLFWLAVVAFAVYSIVRGSRRRHAVPGAVPPGNVAGSTPSGGVPGSTPAPAAHYAGAPAPEPGDAYYAKATTAPSYAGPYAPSAGGQPAGGWAPVPTPPPLPPRPRRRGPGAGFATVVVGIAALAAGTLLALTLAGAVSVSGGAMWATAAVVIGAGILVAGLRGHTAGILSLFAVIALVSAALSLGIERALHADGFPWRSDGPTRVAYTPSTVTEAEHGYQVTAAQGRIDLSALDDAGPLASDRTVPIDVSLSDLTIEIPKDVPVTVRADTTLSSVELGSRSIAGLRQSGSESYNADRPGGTLVLALDTNLSDVKITKEN